MRAIDGGLDSMDPEHPWTFEERHPWERGFAAYAQDWVAPELARWQDARQAKERGFRRRLPLLLGLWLTLTLLVAEASGSLPVTLTWAVLLLIVGGSLARGPLNGVRTRALRSLRDRVMGFFGLRPLSSGKVLESALRTHRLLGDSTRLEVAEQFWGVHGGIGLRLAVLRTRGEARPDRSGTDPGLGLAILIEVPEARLEPRTGRWPVPQGGTAPSADPEDPFGLGLGELSRALGDATLDYAREHNQILILSHRPLEALEWARRVEALDPQSEAEQIESAMRELLRSLHLVLGAARLLVHTSCEKI